MDGACVDGDIVTDGHVAADMRRAGIVRHMYAGAVLHIAAVTDGDGSHVAPHHSIEPYGTLIAYGHVAHDGGVLAEVA